MHVKISNLVLSHNFCHFVPFVDQNLSDAPKRYQFEPAPAMSVQATHCKLMSLKRKLTTTFGLTIT